MSLAMPLGWLGPLAVWAVVASVLAAAEMTFMFELAVVGSTVTEASEIEAESRWDGKVIAGGKKLRIRSEPILWGRSIRIGHLLLSSFNKFGKVNIE